ncbi:ankyrin repeat domain-containing protein [bacterium]|nr:ankyrin repeat domain-containing protein [bacterium]
MKKTVIITCMLMLVFGSVILFGASENVDIETGKNDGIKDALYQHYVLKDYSQAKNEYEIFFKNLNTNVQDSSEILKSGIKNYYQLLKDMNLSNEFGPMMRKIGIEESILKSIVSIGNKSVRRSRGRRRKGPDSLRKPKKESYVRTKKVKKKLKISKLYSSDIDNKISVDVKNFKVANLLELIKNSKKINIVYPKRFSEKFITVKVRNVDYKKVLQMISQSTKTSFFESDNSFIFEDIDEASIKREKKYFIKNMTLSKFQNLILDKLNKENFKLLSITPEKKNSLTANFLITTAEGNKLQKLINSSSSGTYVMAFKLYEFLDSGEKLVSSPKIKVNEGSVGEITVEGKQNKEYSRMKIKTSVRKESPGLYNVKLNIELKKVSDKSESKSSSSSEFNTTGKYDYVIYDNFGKMKYRIFLEVGEVNSELNENADVKVTVKKKKRGVDTSLIRAAKHGHVDIVKMLIESGSDVNARGYRGRTALHSIIEWSATGKTVELNRPKIVELLIKAGASLDIKDNADYTPLHSALYSGNMKIANILISKGCDVNQSDRRRNTPLMIAAGKGNIECINSLIKAGAVIDGKNKYQETAIGVASSKGNKEVVKVLLEGKEKMKKANLKMTVEVEEKK